MYANAQIIFAAKDTIAATSGVDYLYLGETKGEQSCSTSSPLSSSFYGPWDWSPPTPWAVSSTSCWCSPSSLSCCGSSAGADSSESPPGEYHENRKNGAHVNKAA